MSENKELTSKEMGERFDNPIMKNQITGNQFIEDKIGEIRLKGDFVGETRYVSLSDVVQEVRESRKRVILNIGDSSTSGWDSDVVAVNREVKQIKGFSYNQEKDTIFPIFNYRTYSDCLRNLVGNQFVVVNAGVPTHTSLNGLRRLEDIVEKFEKQGVQIDYVTVYYGNNDSACNANLEEKSRNGLGGRVRRMFTPKDRVVTRTSVKDYGENLRKIIEYCRKKAIAPILIEPPIPLYWEPGRRIKRKGSDFDEEDVAIQAVASSKGGNKVLELFRESLNLWKQGNKLFAEGDAGCAIRLYERAREKDYITPRIKREHVKTLHEISEEEIVPLVKIDIPKDKDDGRGGEGYFGDYCHPIEPANILIANGILRAIPKCEQGGRINRKTPLRYVLLEKAVSLASRFYKGRDSSNSEPPKDVYTLY